jgi:hypothetical protein
MKIEPRSAHDQFLVNGEPAGFTVGDFWRWGVSDLLVNTTRGAVAEFIVGRALGCTAAVRDSWGPYDLQTPEGVRVEVKSASYCQAWPTKKPSRICFDIAATREWDSDINEMVGEPKRHADVYVFCLLENQKPSPADPLEISRWTFLVLATSVLDSECKKQKTVSLSTLRSLGPVVCDFAGLRQRVQEASRGGCRHENPATMEHPSCGLIATEGGTLAKPGESE